MQSSNCIVGFMIFLLVLIAHSCAGAQGPATTSSTPESLAAMRPDIEIDPLPYFLHGYSVHVGLGRSHWRFEGEALRTDVPKWMHGNPGFDLSYQGGGVKTQYFLSRQQKGAFLGTRAEMVRMSVRLSHTGFEDRALRRDLGIDGGYRFYLGRHLYVTPWGGLDYAFDARDIRLGNKVFHDRPVGYFGAVHLGYRF